MLKEVILDEFVAATGYARKYAIRLLNHPASQKLTITRPRPPHYGPEVQQALHLAWTAANHICAKQLIPFLPTLVVSLEQHGHLHLSEEGRAQLLAISPATADRILQPYRKQERHGLSTTRSGTLLKKQIPIRTFQEWNDIKPGFLEADLVSAKLCAEGRVPADGLPATPPSLLKQERKRRYQRSERPHDWRTRKDPFEGLWDEITSWLETRPELTAAEIFREIERLYPGQYRPTQARTLRRGIQKLRARLLVTFDDQWGEDVMNGHAPIPELRAEVIVGAF